MAPRLLRVWMRPPVLLFLFGLALRFLLWGMDEAIGRCWHVGFAGDGPVWQDFGPRLAGDLPRDGELLLPWRPPGMQWLIEWGWDRGNWQLLRLWMLLFGAGTGPLLWWLFRPHVAAGTAALAAALGTAASSMLLASSGVQIEAPYVPLVLSALCVHDRLRSPHRAWLPIAWGGLQAGICLLRAEHLLYFVGWFALLAVARVRWTSLALGALTFAAVLVPWQLEAARLVAQFQASPDRWPARNLQWDAAASTKVGQLPGFAQAHIVQLVDDTVRLRGGTRVTESDLDIVREAYGTWPEPIPVPLIALYGGLNFYVANAPEGTDGLWQATDRPPPFLGGEARYPGWVKVRPGEHRQFSLAFPPHLEMALHGYRLGLREILADPASWCGRVLDKFWYALGGAVPGVGCAAWPIGLSGERRPVDMVAATGAWPTVYRFTVLAVALGGLYRLRRQRGLWPLFLFGALKIVVIAAFFGQARHGVLLVPLVALGVAEVANAALARRWRCAPWLPPVGLLVFLAVDAVVVRGTTGHVVYPPDPVGQLSWDYLPCTVGFR